MLIEYVGNAPTYEWRHAGVHCRFEPQEKYRGAKVCNVPNVTVAVLMLGTKMMATGLPIFRRFEFDALEDPEFILQISRHPLAVKYVLEHPEEYPVDLGTLKEELAGTPEDRLRTWAAELGLNAHPQTAPYALREMIASYFSKRPTPEPVIAHDLQPIAHKGRGPKSRNPLHVDA